MWKSPRCRFFHVFRFSCGNLPAPHPQDPSPQQGGKAVLADVAVGLRHDDVVEIYTRDLETGLLTDTGKRIPFHNPSCLKFFVPR